MSGIVRTAVMFGVIAKPSGQSKLIVDSTRVRLGLLLTEFVLKPRKDCTAMVGLVEKYLEYATGAQISWPCQGDAFEHFPGKVFDVMAHIHAIKYEAHGLTGERGLVKRKTKKAEQTGGIPEGLILNSVAGKDYIVKHCTRRFILAADSLNVLDVSIAYKDASKFLPDQTGQTELFEKLTLRHIRMEMGLNPFHLVVIRVFYTDVQLRSAQLHEFLKPAYSELYAEVAGWEKVRHPGKLVKIRSRRTFIHWCRGH